MRELKARVDDLGARLRVGGIHQKWNNYLHTITAAYHHFFPPKSLRVHASNAPWITPRIKHLIQQHATAFYNNT